ncbi:MAG: hypothetical protein Q4C42_11420 [Clostridia bacterium]|nr:hypothetical protein [Clostridia bacterium]
MPRGSPKEHMEKIGKDTRFGAKNGPDPIEAGAKGNEAKAIRKTIKSCLDEKLDRDKVADILAKRCYSGNLKAIQMVLDLMGETGQTGAPQQVQEDDPLTKAMEEMGSNVFTETDGDT